VLIAVNALSVAAKYAVSRRHGFVPPAELQVGGWRAFRAIVVEALAFLLVFGIIQPFERWWMGSDAVGRLAPGQRSVLMIHGYLCNRGLWWWLRRRLRARGVAVATITLAHPLGAIDPAADELAARIDQLLAETRADRIALVGHSMGGLVSRAYLRRHGAGKVDKLVTIATPHHGTVLAHVGPGQNACEMQRGSEWLRRLADGETFSVRVLTIWSVRDEIVVPQDSARLPGADERIEPAIGHLTMVFAPAVLKLLEAELT
jgi:triacylglycerol lipase